MMPDLGIDMKPMDISSFFPKADSPSYGSNIQRSDYASEWSTSISVNYTQTKAASLYTA